MPRRLWRRPARLNSLTSKRSGYLIRTFHPRLTLPPALLPRSHCLAMLVLCEMGWSLLAAPAILPDSQVIKEGETASLALDGGPATGTSYQWYRNGVSLAGQTNWYLLLPRVTATEQGNYVLQVRPGASPATNLGPSLVRVMPVPPGTLDAHYNAGFGADAAVYSLAKAGDGAVLAGGVFGVSDRALAANLVRLRSDGTMEEAFSAGFMQDDGGVFAIQPQSDGNALIGGSFTLCHGQPAGGIVQLLANGALNSGFRSAPGVSGVGEHSLPEPPVPAVFALATLPDGRIRVGGLFTHMHGVPRPGIAGLLSNGEVDPAFDPGEGLGNEGESWPAAVRTLALAAPNLTLVAGDFTSFDGQPAGRLVGLEESGRRSAGFNVGAGFDSVVNALAVQTDGRILAGGRFRSYQGVRRVGVARLLPDGQLDESFKIVPELVSVSGQAEVFALVALADGGVLVGGRFDRIGGAALVNLARLLPDGSVDRGFGTTPLAWSGSGLALCDLGADGVMVGGQFSLADPAGLAGLIHLVAGREIPAPKLSLGRTGDGQLKLSVATLPDVTYWLQSRATVAAGDWLTAPAVAGDGAVHEWLRPIAPRGGEFHRVATKHAQPPTVVPASLRDRALVFSAAGPFESGPAVEPFAVQCGDTTFALSSNSLVSGEQGTYAYAVIGSREAALFLTSTDGSVPGWERRFSLYSLAGSQALFRYEFLQGAVLTGTGVGLVDLHPAVLPGPRRLQPRLGPECLEWSLQVSGVDLTQALRDGHLVSDPSAGVFRETGTVSAAGLEMEYSVEAVGFDETGCPTEITVTASGTLLNPSPQTVHAARE